ncbi:AAA family ATPase [Streptomyces sp. RB6PN25]|uniref:Nuclease SbcCD subunit C n=1 Tax=Streptomyces humicola TaxID=2953240 RepID=A0ABT1Q051_9ACTN|nr:AAA family ATPase [Streptomyces humicola]MCQ4082160.1 AAA family ATPase [Streptomyces humicola]
MSDEPSPPMLLRDVLLSRLLESGLAPEAQDVLREVVPEAPVRSDGQARSLFLRSITAAGWRGIGPATSLDLRPEPGLTVIAGRNGSGKSSVAEAAEMALTGGNYRWQDRTLIWKKGWRNLHDHADPQVSVELCADDGSAPVTVRRRWSGPGVDDCRTEVEGGASALHEVIDPEQISLYRPFLPYSELGAVITGPSTALHDTLAKLLGLELLSDIYKQVSALLKKHQDEVAASKALTETVLRELSEHDDPRAAEAVAALEGRHPDLDRMRLLLAGNTVADDTALARLRRLAVLQAPDRQAVAAAVARLRKAAADAEDVRCTSAEDARQLIDLLERALAHRRRHPDSTECPVCGSADRLDGRWAEGAREQVERLQSEAEAAQAARRELAAAVRDVHDAVQPVPAWLQADEPSLAALWRDWAACRAVPDPRELADRAERAEAVLGDACHQVREDAARRLDEQDGRWQTVAGRLTEWLRHAEAAQRAEDRIKQVKAARTWLQKLTDELREARLKPIADQSQMVWKLLCERSSVSLGSISLAGAAAQRKVVLDVSVDAMDAPAFGVMSQGELHSLALSLFIPRATHESSPFKFLVIDDPVQSMDPEKVDGLARVLDLYAQHRQVVVFTHDTRLEEAIRRLGIRATIKQVSRQTDSVVRIVPVSDPVTQALDEARAIALDGNLPPDVADRVLPAMCRVALEAALLARARSTLRAAGLDWRAIEDRIAKADSLTALAAIALDVQHAIVLDVIAQDHGAWATDLIRQCNKASHQASEPVGDRRDLVRRTERLAKAVLAR